MVHDSQLFTLTLFRRRDDVRMMDLVPMQPSYNPSDQTVHPSYTFSRAVTMGPSYDVQLVDSLLLLPLASVQSDSTLERTKEIQLMNPDATAVLEKQKMTFKQEWRFQWEQNEFACRRDGKEYEIVAIRKPDPEIEIARYHSRTKARPAFFQMFDYNVQRIEVGDKRGLEVLVIMAFLVSLDVEYDERRKDRETGNIYMGAPITRPVDPSNENGYWSGPRKAERLGTEPGVAPVAAGSEAALANTSSTPVHSPSKPPRKDPRQSYRPEANEIVVDLHTPIEVLAQHAINLLRVDVGGQGCYMIILRSLTPQTSFVAVRVAAEVKSKWSKLAPTAKGRTLDPPPGSRTSEVAEELFQYVRDPSLDGRKSAAAPPPSSPPSMASPRSKIIKLNAPQPAGPPSDYGSSSSSSTTSGAASEPYAAPEELAIFLSKEKIEEFEASQRRPVQSAISSSSSRPSASAASPGPSPSKPPKVPSTNPKLPAKSPLSRFSQQMPGVPKPSSSRPQSPSSQQFSSGHGTPSDYNDDSQPSVGRKLMGKLRHIGHKIPSE